MIGKQVLLGSCTKSVKLPSAELQGPPMIAPAQVLRGLAGQ